MIFVAGRQGDNHSGYSSLWRSPYFVHARVVACTKREGKGSIAVPFDPNAVQHFVSVSTMGALPH